MRQERKARIQQLASDLQKLSSFEAQSIREMVDLLFEEAKHRLVEASGDELLKTQGEARALASLYRQLTRQAPELKGTEQ